MNTSQFLQIRGVRLEYLWLGPAPEQAPTLVFLHEGLGCVSLWRDFPEQLARQTGCGALVYSRAGYGGSDPAPLPRPISFMHDEAATLAEILQQTGVREPILLGHSDGASIALIYASRNDVMQPRGLVLEAPHVFTEPEGLENIAKIAEDYRTSDLRERLARHHGANTDIAFWGWNNVWLHPEFRSWNIESLLPAITAPILVIQGEQDAYGTWRQVEAIERQARGSVEVLAVPQCGHTPHREQTEFILPSVVRFIKKLTCC
jgi:pimeloyl-ACP methyl ester carboxylesterase